MVLVLFAFSLFSQGSSTTVSAAAGINHQINFQGKLVNPSGTNVTDGSYSIVFSLYSTASGGAAIWTETQSPTITNGIFQVNLGSVTALPGSVDFNTDNLYLGIKVGADAEMTPRIQFTSVPQAFNSEKLGGIDKTGFIQNQTASPQAAGFNINGAGTVATLNVTSTSTFGGAVNLGAAGTTLGQLKFYTAANSGSVTLQGAANNGNYTVSFPSTLTGNDTVCLQTTANCGGSGVTTVGTYSTTNIAVNGATITGSSIIFQDASASAPGMVGTGTQTFAGVKTFSTTSNIVFGNGTTGGIQVGDGTITKTTGQNFSLNSGLTFSTSSIINVLANGSANASGNSLTLQAGAANGSTTGNVGGVLALQGGAAAGTGNNNGGSITLDGGGATGTGTKGTIVLQGGGGNVGIGTAAPSQLLHLSSTSDAAIALQTTGVPQAASSASSTSTVINSAAVGSLAWSSPANGSASDNAYATSTGTGTTNYLKATGFGFSIPANATITGVVLSVERNSTGSTPGSQTFNYTGGQQSWTVPAGVTTITVDSYGAQGGYNQNPYAYGGLVHAVIPVTPGQTLYFNVGGLGGSPSGVTPGPGGWNGGAAGGSAQSGYVAGGGGGGMSDVRQGGTGTANIVVVAGGGGGGNADNAIGAGGHGGNPGQKGADSGSNIGGGGGTQTGGGTAGTPSCGAANGAAFQGGAGCQSFAGSGGGGGGYYGGGGGGNSACCVPAGGGGGASWAEPSATGVSYTTGAQSGNGQIAISYTASSTPAVDSQISLVKSSGAISTTNKAVGTAWPSSDTVATYGSSSDLWSETLTPTDINSPNFGAVVSASMSSSGTANVDSIGMTVYYTVPITFAWSAGVDQSDGGKFKISASTSVRTTTALTVTPAGNIGIGTTSPGYKLQVTDQTPGSFITAKFVGETAGLALQNTFGTQYEIQNVSHAAGALPDHLILYDRTNSAYRLVVSPSGNIGIGTGAVSPAARLQVVGAANTSFAPASWTQNVILDNASGSTQNITELRVAGTRRGSLRVDTSGNIILNGSGAGSIYLGFDEGTGGVNFGNGAGVTKAYIDTNGSLFTGRIDSFNNPSNNLHLDALNGGDSSIYLNYYSGANVKIGNGAQGVVAAFNSNGALSLNGALTVNAGSSNFGTTTSCCGSNYTIGISEATGSNSRLPTIQFHASGYQEGFIRLASADRTFEFGDSQGAGAGLAILNGSGTRVVKLQTNGSVVIGTGATIDQYGVYNGVGLNLTSGGAIAGNLCLGSTSCNNKLGVYGNIGASGSVNSFTTPDISETITAAPGIEAADVVMADPNNTERVVKTTGAYSGAAVGVIADGTSSFQIHSLSDMSSANPDAGKKPLVLAGRVPVKISNEGGAVAPGDYLTSSSTPGYAMKATHAGPTIGKALGFLDGTAEKGTVLALINVSYYNPNLSADIQANNATFNTMTISGGASMGNLNVGGLATLGSLQVMGSADIAANLHIGGDLTVVGSASIGGNLDVGGNLTVKGLTTVMDIVVGGHVITAGNAPTGEVLAAAGSAHASVAITGNDTSGTITLTVGDPSAAAAGQNPAVIGPSIGDLVKLHFNKAFGKQPRIMINGNDPASAKLVAFPAATTLDSFNLAVGNQPAAHGTYSFTYWAVE